MKESIRNAGFCIYKNYKTIILIVILTILVTYNIKLKNDLYKFLENDISGTYCIDNKAFYDSEYFVFVKDKYYRYRQFELLDKGVYEHFYEYVYSLKSETEDQYVICANNKLYFLDKENNGVLIYSKVSDNAIFLNVDVKINR